MNAELKEFKERQMAADPPLGFTGALLGRSKRWAGNWGARSEVCQSRVPVLAEQVPIPMYGAHEAVVSPQRVTCAPQQPCLCY